MTTYDKIRDEKLQYNINREAAEISTLSSGKLINMNMLWWRNTTFRKTNKNNWRAKKKTSSSLRSFNNKQKLAKPKINWRNFYKRDAN